MAAVCSDSLLWRRPISSFIKRSLTNSTFRWPQLPHVDGESDQQDLGKKKTNKRSYLYPRLKFIEVALASSFRSQVSRANLLIPVCIWFATAEGKEKKKRKVKGKICTTRFSDSEGEGETSLANRTMPRFSEIKLLKIQTHYLSNKY